jgi:hypothetical protein
VITGVRVIKTIAYDMRIGEVLTIGNQKVSIAGFSDDMKQVQLTPIYDTDTLHDPNIRRLKAGAQYALDINALQPEKNVVTLNETRLPIGDIAHGDKL